MNDSSSAWSSASAHGTSHAQDQLKFQEDQAVHAAAGFLNSLPSPLPPAEPWLSSGSGAGHDDAVSAGMSVGGPAHGADATANLSHDPVTPDHPASDQGGGHDGGLPPHIDPGSFQHH